MFPLVPLLFYTVWCSRKRWILFNPTFNTIVFALRLQSCQDWAGWILEVTTPRRRHCDAALPSKGLAQTADTVVQKWASCLGRKFAIRQGKEWVAHNTRTFSGRPRQVRLWGGECIWKGCRFAWCYRHRYAGCFSVQYWRSIQDSGDAPTLPWSRVWVELGLALRKGYVPRILHCRRDWTIVSSNQSIRNSWLVPWISSLLGCPQVNGRKSCFRFFPQTESTDATCCYFPVAGPVCVYFLALVSPLSSIVHLLPRVNGQKPCFRLFRKIK